GEVPIELLRQLPLRLVELPTLRHDAAEPRSEEGQGTVYEVAEIAPEVAIHVPCEPLEREVGVVALGCVRGQPPAPVVGGQKFASLVEEGPAPLAGRELATLVGKPVHTLDHVDAFPRLAGADKGAREAHGMERYVVLA